MTTPRTVSARSVLAHCVVGGLLPALLICSVPALIAADAEHEPTQQIDHDTDFYTEVNQANLFLVKTSELAIKRNVTGDLLEYAKMMVIEHAQSDADLTGLAADNGVTVSAILHQSTQAQHDALAQTGDAEFIASYLQSQITAHQRAIELFTATAERSTDSKLKAFIAAKLPTLQAHLAEAQRLAAVQ